MGMFDWDGDSVVSSSTRRSRSGHHKTSKSRDSSRSHRSSKRHSGLASFFGVDSGHHHNSNNHSSSHSPKHNNNNSSFFNLGNSSSRSFFSIGEFIFSSLFSVRSLARSIYPHTFAESYVRERGLLKTLQHNCTVPVCCRSDP